MEDNLTKLVFLVDESIATQNSICGAKRALEHMDYELNAKIIPFIRRTFSDEAREYVQKRNEYNVSLFVLASDVIKLMKDLFCDMECVSVHIMSSLNAKLNLIGESDIDIGLLVDGLNNDDMSLNDELFQQIKLMIETTTEFKFENVFNEIDPTNRYYSFVNMIDGIEVELKVRDKVTSQTILELHNYLDNVLDEESKIFITYAKFLLKKHQKEYNTQSYKKFKQVLYEACFSYVEGGFLMPYTL